MLGRSHPFFLEIMTYILSDNNEINSPTQIFANYHIRALHQDQDQTEKGGQTDDKLNVLGIH